MFYRATSTVERVIKGIAEFLEHTPMKEWDKESKVFHSFCSAPSAQLPVP